MKTLKALKITSILNGIFCFCCILSIGGLAIGNYYDSQICWSIGNILTITWIINPIGLVSFGICLSLFLKERKNQEAKQIMGKKWIWIFIWPIITTVVYLMTGGMFAAITGGV